MFVSIMAVLYVNVLINHRPSATLPGEMLPSLAGVSLLGAKLFRSCGGIVLSEAIVLLWQQAAKFLSEGIHGMFKVVSEGNSAGCLASSPLLSVARASGKTITITGFGVKLLQPLK